MTPPFADLTRPNAVLFSARTSGGDVISLRVPAADDPVCCGPDDAELFGAAFEDQMPCWWVEYVDCPGDADGCCCGATRLADVIEQLAASDRTAAVAAHVGQAQELVVHLAALERSVDGTLDDICVACVTDPAAHEVDLDATIDEMARDLLDALAVAGVTLPLRG